MIVVAGENVVDLVPAPGGLLRPELGGGPATVAVAAARLGARVAMAARLGADPFGAAFRERLVVSGVDPRYLVDSDDPSTLALVTMAGTDARYDFWLTGCADFGWTDAELPVLTPADIAHVGSLAAFLPPGADTLASWAAGHRAAGGTVTFDPNLRPPVLADRPATLRRLTRLVGAAHLVKASEEDVRAAYPDLPVGEAVRGWLTERDPHTADADGSGPGPELVVLTRGSAGMTALTRSGDQITVPAPSVTTVDTIGAGDTAMGALLAEVSASGLPGVLADLPAVLRRMCAAAALTCTRAGPRPPTATEVAALVAAAR